MARTDVIVLLEKKTFRCCRLMSVAVTRPTDMESTTWLTSVGDVTTIPLFLVQS